MQTIFCPWRRPTQDHQNKISFQIPEKVTVANFDTASGMETAMVASYTRSPKLKRKMNPDWLFSFQSRVYNIHGLAQYLQNLNLIACINTPMHKDHARVNQLRPLHCAITSPAQIYQNSNDDILFSLTRLDPDGVRY